MRIAVLGAGIAGLSAARALQAGGHRVTVFDKGRGPGGRTSSRRSPFGSFDHGAPSFTARSPEFALEVRRWAADGVVAPWRARLGHLRPAGFTPILGAIERFVGVPRMSALTRYLATGLRVLQGRVIRLEHGGSGWALTGEDGSRAQPFDALVVTVPAPQAAVLLGGHSFLAEVAATEPMQASWVAMAAFDRPVDVPFDGVFCQDDALAWACRESSKPARGAEDRWVLHGTGAWSEQRFGAVRDDVFAELWSRFEQLAGLDGLQPAYTHTMFWRYARPTVLRDEPAPFDEDRRLLLATDAFFGGRVEGAFLGGRAAAEQLVGSLGNAKLTG